MREDLKNNTFAVTHGKRYHHSYKRWGNMMSRCYDKKHKRYSDWGGRGITVSDEFKDISVFLDYIDTLDNSTKKGYVIDRINNEGNYERGNLRFVDNSISSINKRISIRNSSGYSGVTKRSYGRYRSYVSYLNKKIHIGTFDSPESAVFARNRYIVENDLPHEIQQIKLQWQ